MLGAKFNQKYLTYHQKFLSGSENVTNQPNRVSQEVM